MEKLEQLQHTPPWKLRWSQALEGRSTFPLMLAKREDGWSRS